MVASCVRGTGFDSWVRLADLWHTFDLCQLSILPGAASYYRKLYLLLIFISTHLPLPRSHYSHQHMSQPLFTNILANTTQPIFLPTHRSQPLFTNKLANTTQPILLPTHLPLPLPFDSCSSALPRVCMHGTSIVYPVIK